ncbi:hypothetical protein BJY01DRAFT_32337 [Aspergillus pseudoustus]|uniref:Secreted protein n=1 Tax=Aspergillus pseudoustus TaxID=1810923 RepID=A0ABR4JFV3_9EURO
MRPPCPLAAVPAITITWLLTDIILRFVKDTATAFVCQVTRLSLSLTGSDKGICLFDIAIVTWFGFTSPPPPTPLPSPSA